MVNQEYWKTFYKLGIAPSRESQFARFIYNYIEQTDLSTQKLIDVACGNGRDSFFFASKGIDTTGVDLAFVPDEENCTFFQENILKIDYSKYNLIYLRFVVHALSEEDFDVLLNRIWSTASNAKIFIETRSTKGVTDDIKAKTFFKSAIGEEHFRMLYSKSYLVSKIEPFFKIELCEESNDFAPFRGAKPYCIRLILSKK